MYSTKQHWASNSHFETQSGNCYSSAKEAYAEAYATNVEEDLEEAEAELTRSRSRLWRCCKCSFNNKESSCSTSALCQNPKGICRGKDVQGMAPPTKGWQGKAAKRNAGAAKTSNKAKSAKEANGTEEERWNGFDKRPGPGHRRCHDCNPPPDSMTTILVRKRAEQQGEEDAPLAWLEQRGYQSTLEEYMQVI